MKATQYALHVYRPLSYPAYGHSQKSSHLLRAVRVQDMQGGQGLPTPSGLDPTGPVWSKYWRRASVNCLSWRVVRTYRKHPSPPCEPPPRVHGEGHSLHTPRHSIGQLRPRVNHCWWCGAINLEASTLGNEYSARPSSSYSQQDCAMSLYNRVSISFNFVSLSTCSKSTASGTRSFAARDSLPQNMNAGAALKPATPPKKRSTAAT